eukprot:jgi/Ulvmu1/10445/UM062_0042.1
MSKNVNVSAHLARTRDGLLLVSGGDRCNICFDHALRSTFLSEVLHTSAEGDVIPLPFHGRVLQLWLSSVKHPVRTRNSDTPIEEMADMLQAADVLGDNTATASLAALLAARIFPPASEELHLLENFMLDSRDEERAIEGSLAKEGTLHAAMELRAATSSEVLETLSQDLMLAVMRAVHHLPTLFRSLPPCMHTLALRARHPSIDAARTLSATCRDSVEAAHTARAAAALTQLTSLSISTSGTRFPSGLASFHRVLHAFGEAQCPVSLDVSNSLPQHLDLPAHVMLQNLPHLGCLCSLAMSPASIIPGLSILAPHLSLLSSLHTLDISGSQCRTPYALWHKDSWDATKEQPPMEALATLPALRDLSLGGIGLSDTGWAAISQHLSTRPLTSLNLSNCGLKRKFQLLHSTPCTPSTDDPYTTAPSAADARAAEDPDSHNPAGDGAASTAGTMWVLHDTLVHLKLSHNDFRGMSGACCGQLKSLPALQTLDVSVPVSSRDHHLISTSIVKAIGSGAAFRLRSLDIQGLGLGPHGAMLRAALRVHTGLTALNLSATRADVALIEALQCVLQLRSLWLDSNPELWQMGTDWRHAVHVLGTLTALRVLSLASCHLHDRQVVALAQHLTSLSNLKAVDLSRNPICRQGGLALTAWTRMLPALGMLRMNNTSVPFDVQVSIVGQLQPRVQIKW